MFYTHYSFNVIFYSDKLTTLLFYIIIFIFIFYCSSLYCFFYTLYSLIKVVSILTKQKSAYLLLSNFQLRHSSNPTLTFSKPITLSQRTTNSINI